MKTARSVKISFAICLFIFFLHNQHIFSSQLTSQEKKAIEQLLSTLSPQERNDLEHIFTDLIFYHQCAYPFFGTKPMSLGALPSTDMARNGFLAWKKIAPLFSSHQFVIRDYTLNNRTFILTANLSTVEKTYIQNKDLLTAISHYPLDLTEFMSCLQNDTPLFQDLIHNHVMLGIFLGYGVTNAQRFPAHCQDRTTLSSFSTGHPLLYYFSAAMPLFLPVTLIRKRPLN